MSLNSNNSINQLLNFGVLIGVSFEDMEGLNISGVHSDISEIGVNGNLPIDHIKFLAVPDDKVEFVKKMVGEKDIDVVSMDMKDKFFNNDFIQKLSMLEQDKETTDLAEEDYPTYSKEDVKPVVNERKVSKIKEIFEMLKAKLHTKAKQTDDKDIGGRG